MNTLGLNYNTEKEGLIYREYGRNIQKLINFCKTMEDREKRTLMANAIVNLMGEMHPNLRNLEEFKQKLWNQLYTIADFDLDVDSPHPVPNNYGEVKQIPGDIAYPQGRIKKRHYGKNIDNLVRKAKTIKDPDKQLEFAKVIASYMKIVHKNWNRENISDEVVKNDLYQLSDGELDLREEESIVAASSRRTSNNNNNNSNNRRRRRVNHNDNKNDHRGGGRGRSSRGRNNRSGR